MDSLPPKPPTVLARVQFSNSSPIWTTHDELTFLKGMRAKGNIKAMRNYVATAHLRTWPIYQGKMHVYQPVDAAMCILTAQDLLKEMEAEQVDRELGGSRGQDKAQ